MTTQRKSRTITFRLADEEYEQFRALYSAGGARSISDLVRRAIESLLRSEPAVNGTYELVDRVSRIDQRVDQLEARMEDLRRQVFPRSAASAD